jgi:dynein heavy chain
MTTQLSKTYTFNDWREDLKNIVRNAGEADKPTVFLFSDSQIKTEAFLVDINNLLNSGEVDKLPVSQRIPANAATALLFLNLH